MRQYCPRHTVLPERPWYTEGGLTETGAPADAQFAVVPAPPRKRIRLPGSDELEPDVYVTGFTSKECGVFTIRIAGLA